MTQNPEATEYGRCEATSKTTGEQCGRAALGDHGKCGYHGGKSTGAPEGPENGNFKHGLYSDVVREEDRATLEAIEEMSTRAKLESTLNMQVLKLRRAVESLESSKQGDFWSAFEHLIEEIEGPEETDLRALAKMLGQNERAIREWMDLIRRTAKDLHKISDGETVNHEHDVGDLEEVKGLVESAYGDGE